MKHWRYRMRVSGVVRCVGLLGILCLGGAEVPGCVDPNAINCPDGWTAWLCDFYIGNPNVCGRAAAIEKTFSGCGTVRSDALEGARGKAVAWALTHTDFQDGDVHTIDCTNTGMQNYPNSVDPVDPVLDPVPEYMTQGGVGGGTCISGAGGRRCRRQPKHRRRRRPEQRHRHDLHPRQSVSLRRRRDLLQQP